MRLDPDRVRRAGARARAAAEAQAYHLGQAEIERVKCDSLCRTWGLDPVTFAPLSTNGDNDEASAKPKGGK